jgi:hypothetical protein
MMPGCARALGIFILLAGLLGPLSGGVRAGELSGRYDLLLVLAVDCSGSVSGTEFQLQIGGIARALRDADVIAAALAGPSKRIGVNLMLWGDPDYPKFATGWHEINSPETARAFADIVQAYDLRMGGGTGLGHAVAYGVSILQDSGAVSDRLVIDVSGDGAESYELRKPRFQLVDAQRLRAKAGVVVNGLAITNEDRELARYYREKLAAGPGSFVMQVARYEDFSDAIRLKLLREINPLSSARDLEQKFETAAENTAASTQDLLRN